MTVAVFTRFPLAVPDILAVTVYVILEPAGILTESLILPEPLAVQVAPPALTHVQVALVICAGKLSVTVAPITLAGPLLETVIVYVVELPTL